jgi:hypothetical protein
MENITATPFGRSITRNCPEPGTNRKTAIKIRNPGEAGWCPTRQAATMLQTAKSDDSKPSISPLARRKKPAATRIAGALLALTMSCSGQLVLQPNEALSKDAKVYEFMGNMNFQSNLGVIGIGSSPHSFKAAIQFDLAGIPYDPEEITLATLEFYASTADGAGDVSLYPILAEWGETAVTFNTFPTYSATATDTVSITTAGQWYSFDVTDAVQDWHSGAIPNFGFAIIMDTATGNVAFLDAGGRETAPADPTLAPRLTVVPEPGTALLGLIGFAACAVRRIRQRHSS